MIETFLLIGFGLLISGLLGYLIYRIIKIEADKEDNTNKAIDRLFGKVERNILRKFKGVSEEDQKLIDIASVAIKKDVESSLNHLEASDKKIELPDFPAFQEAIEKEPSLLGALLGNEGMIGQLLPLLSQGQNVGSLLNLLTVENAKLAAGAGLALKVVQGITSSKNKSSKETTAVQSTRDKDISDHRPSKVITKFHGKM